MSLYLAQHGEAYSEEVDPQRRLTERGRTETRKVAQRLSEMGIAVDVILHSGKTRARETAEIFAQYIKPKRVEEAEGLNPNDDPRIWAERLRDLQDSVFIVGHLPHLSRLTSLLLVGNPDAAVVKFRYSAVLKLERGGAGWLVAWYLTPELLPL